MPWISIARTAILGAVMFYPALSQSSSQKSAADLVELVRPAVVQIVVEMTEPPIKRVPSPLEQCFKGRLCVVGTGFFVNANGDVVTASHVASGVQMPGRLAEPGVQQIIQILKANGINAISEIGVSAPNVEIPGKLEFESNAQLIPATLVATDAAHDVAAFHATVNPFTNMPQGFGIKGVPKTKAALVHLAPARPRDGEEIFACGFPFGDSGLVTTSGTIASAWKYQTLPTAGV